MFFSGLRDDPILDQLDHVPAVRVQQHPTVPVGGQLGDRAQRLRQLSTPETAEPTATRLESE